MLKKQALAYEFALLIFASNFKFRPQISWGNGV
jgi:hypothetical protein